MSLLVSAAVTWALVAAGFSLVAAVKVWRGRALTRPRAPGELPPVLLLRPVEAPTALELENLWAPVDYPGQLEQVVVSPERLELPPGMGFVASSPSTPNRKVGHLLTALAAQPTRRVVLAIDADVRVDGALVTALASAVHEGAALSFAAPEPSLGVGLASRSVRALLVRTHHGFRALDAMRVGPKAVCGKAVGLGPAALGLLPQLTAVVGEDLELAVRLFDGGERVELVASPARVPQGRVQARAVLARFSRWMQVLKAHRPGLFPTVPLLFAPTLPLLVLAGVAASGVLWASVAGLVVARATLAWVQLPSREPGEWPWLEWLLAEALLLTAFARAALARRLVWRGRAFELRRGGRMVPT